MDRKFGSKNASVVKKEAVEERPAEVYNSPSKEIVRLRLLLAAHVKATGTKSGRAYEWAKAGAELDVLAVDAPDLLQKTRSGSCCGGGSSPRKPIFEVVT